MTFVTQFNYFKKSIDSKSQVVKAVPIHFTNRLYFVS